MGEMTLREAADRTSRSITTLRRYIRNGRLSARMRRGRYGPEYHVSEEDLGKAGLHPVADESAAARPPEQALATASGSRALSTRRPPPTTETVPLRLYEELQMKHEQLLVQYGMVRAAGLQLLELRAELEHARGQAEDLRRMVGRLRRGRRSDSHGLLRKLRESELELEGKRIEIAALREKVRGLEMLTRNSVTNESIERQFSEVMAQVRRVDRLTAEQSSPGPEWPSPGTPTDH